MVVGGRCKEGGGLHLDKLDDSDARSPGNALPRERCLDGVPRPRQRRAQTRTAAVRLIARTVLTADWRTRSSVP